MVNFLCHIKYEYRKCLHLVYEYGDYDNADRTLLAEDALRRGAEFYGSEVFLLNIDRGFFLNHTTQHTVVIVQIRE